MPGRTALLVVAILSLMIIDIYGLPPKDDFRRCPSGTPISGACNSLTFPSTCPSGYHCYSLNQGPGFCCPNSAKVTCSNGGNPAGPCSPLSGADQCPAGHFCTLGTCCPLDIGMQKPLPTCQNGVTPKGRCVHSVTNQCAGGFFCQDVPGDIRGICCPTGIVQPPPGSCPVVNNIGPCVILPGHCLSDDECRQGQRCCPDGCGKVCKYVGGGSYFPGSDLRG
ncbi:hypothetical protein CHS0354_018087 [Potamilus streckersoni]|uniref:WAP domain-containing protein n=1 Tax=Potamilus streckersoni TaxID=2493646 RepID=A0AAE0TL44_9BIVA|nr:hypothetical protein CHS0354_018087 [Potamilus streckersoni]